MAAEHACACGAPMTPRSTRCRRCTIRLAQARYRITEKCKTKEARYRNSEKGKAKDARSNARRLWLGGSYRGRAQTVEQAAAIRLRITERVQAFREGQRAEASAYFAKLPAS
jgi:hypothetical protein